MKRGDFEITKWHHGMTSYQQLYSNSAVIVNVFLPS